MQTFGICFVALLAVAFGNFIHMNCHRFLEKLRFSFAARSAIDDVDYFKGANGFDDRIHGGKDTYIREHPTIVSLRRDEEHKCGGSIISTVRALTAARCLERNVLPHRFAIFAGTDWLHGNAKTQARRLSRFVIHERWNTPRDAHDIAILFWEGPLTFGATVRPIRLPAANAAVPYGQQATATGWGYTRGAHNPPSNPNRMHTVTMPLVNDEDCKRAYPGKITPDMVCAGGEDILKGSMITRNRYSRLIDVIAAQRIFFNCVFSIF